MSRSVPSCFDAIRRTAVMLMLGAQGAMCADPGPPKGLMEHLSAEDFKARQEAQDGLLKWGRQKPAEAKEWLYQRSKTDVDPEIRRRCQTALRDLVIEEFAQQGEGFLGIMMQGVAVIVPGDEGQRFGIRITFVVPGSPVNRARIPVGELIIGAGDQIWRGEDAVPQFQDWIRKQRPGTRVTLKLLRPGKPLETTVVLERRPGSVDNMLPLGVTPDLAKLQEREKDTYFKEWLEKRKNRR